MSTNTFLSLYKTLVHPHLKYGNVIWGPFYTLDQNRIENVQRAASTIHRSNILVMNKDSRFSICQHLYRQQWGDMICVYTVCLTTSV